MKAFLRMVFLLAVLAAPALVVWHGFAEREHHEEEKTAEEHEAEPGVVKLTAEARERIGLELAELATGTLKPEVVAFAQVLDPAPLAALDDEISAAEAASEASRAASSRAQTLFQSGENVARKQVELADSQLRSDEIKLSALRRRLVLEWGEAVGGMDVKARHELITRLIAGRTAMIRADLAAGGHLVETPKAGRVAFLGFDGQPLAARDIVSAASVDPKTQAQSFLLLVDAGASSLRGGMAATAWLEGAGETQNGAIVPREAVVRFDGRTWIYTPTGDDEFKRTPVILGTPLPEGYFVTDAKAGSKVVVRGAPLLLSQEAKSMGAGDEE